MRRTSVLSLLLVASAVVTAAEPPPVAYPKDYRSWQHVKSMVIEAGHPLYESFGGIHHLYANDKALQGYASGKFPDGAVIAFDLLEARRADNAISEGPRKVLGVMHKDARRYAATGGWGFEGFAGGDAGKRAVADKAASACYGCHAGQKDHDYVFSRTRD